MEDINIIYGIHVLRPGTAEDLQIKWTRIGKPFTFFYSADFDLSG